MTDPLATAMVPLHAVAPSAGTSPQRPANGPTPHFSVATLVTDAAVYLRMVETFAARGFVPPVAEFLYVDNRQQNSLDGYAGLRRLISASRGRLVIAVHQDVLLLDDGVAQLADRVAELDSRFPDWAIAGNAGMRGDGRLASRLTDPHETDSRRGGPFPVKVVSLDENFLVIRRDAGILPSEDLQGFHFYGLDLCLQARLAGRSAHVIDFHLRHLGHGVIDVSFFACRDALEAKYASLMPPTVLRTTCETVVIAPGIAHGAMQLLRRPLAAWYRRRDN